MFMTWSKNKKTAPPLQELLGTMSALVTSLEEHAAAASQKIDFHNAEMIRHNEEFEQASRVALKVKDLIS